MKGLVYPAPRDRSAGVILTAAEVQAPPVRRGPTPGAMVRRYLTRDVVAVAEDVKRTRRLGVDGWLFRVSGHYQDLSADTHGAQRGLRLLLSVKDDPGDPLDANFDHLLLEAETAATRDGGVGVGRQLTAAGYANAVPIDLPFWIPVTAAHRFGVTSASINVNYALLWEVELR